MASDHTTSDSGDCSDALLELYEYLDGELTASRRADIAQHLTACGECFEAFDFQAELKQVIRRKCSNDEMPPGLLAKIETCFNEDFDGDGIIGQPDAAETSDR
jgi:anti-sigma factor (TIGR02949 family)